jgi:hypothetical protein
MPAAHTDTSVHAPITAQSRRRVWAHPDLTSHSLLVLTSDRLYLAPLAGPPKPEVVAAAVAGTDLGDLLGPLATEVDLATVRRVRLDLLANTLALDYETPRHGRSRQAITFAAAKTADACFTKVWRRLGSGCDLVPYRRDWWALARAPLAILGVVLLATAVLALGLSFVDGVGAGHAASVNLPGSDDRPVLVSRTALGSLAAWLDWRAVCAVGGAAAAAAQVWLYRRLTTPPVSLELARA